MDGCVLTVSLTWWVSLFLNRQCLYTKASNLKTGVLTWVQEDKKKQKTFGCKISILQDGQGISAGQSLIKRVSQKGWESVALTSLLCYSGKWSWWLTDFSLWLMAVMAVAGPHYPSALLPAALSECSITELAPSAKAAASGGPEN